jgi:hypothetical protein
VKDASDPLAYSADELLHEWFHWWHNTSSLPAHLPQALHVRTAAYLAARATDAGHKIYNPRDL